MSGERVDLVDADGVVQAWRVLRVRYDANRERYPGLHMQIAVVVVFNNGGHVLAHERSHTKDVYPNHIDHVCGAVKSGETGEDAAHRETGEEGGVQLDTLTLVSSGVNQYGRYRWLFAATTQDAPELREPEDVEWLDFMPVSDLEAARDDGSHKFVADYFEELHAARSALIKEPL